MNTESPLHRFINRLHRRLVVMRLLEGAGLGILTGCAVALLLAGVLIWRGQPVFVAALGVVGIGAVGGMIWAATRRPGKFWAAMEADRQLGLSDLFGTAWGIIGGQDNGHRSNYLDSTSRTLDPWQQTVVCLADAKCEAISPSSVVFYRLGGRSWGGIGLALLLVAAIAAFSETLRKSRAEVARGPMAGVSAAVIGIDTGSSLEQSSGVGKKRAQGTGPVESEFGPRAGDQTSDQGTETEDPGPGGNEKGTPRSTGDDGTGGGTGSADQTSVGGAKQGTPDAEGSESDSATEIGSGTGKTGLDPKNGESGTVGATTVGGFSRRIPPWKRSSWQKSVMNAQEAVNSGRVPDAYRDLVNGYFDDDGATDSN